MIRLKSLEIINNSDRNSSIDVFRSFAIISVVLFHFNNFLPLGYVGVDLFFVISGLLVGGLLIKQFKEKNNINFFRFFIQRGLKIWPSYYLYIFASTIISLYFHPETFHFSDIYKYIFFYENYTGVCTIVWSLCVEEHFYILLPLLFLIVIHLIPDNYKIRSLFIFVFLTILAGMLFKFTSYLYPNNKNTFYTTHYRIDALAWGVLLALLLSYFKEKIQRMSLLFFASGAMIFTISLMLNGQSFIYDRVLFYSIVPFSFFLMIAGLYNIDIPQLKPLRFIAYYSYNWYLWHSIIAGAAIKYLGNTYLILVLYLIVSFILAMVVTILVEEPILKNREIVLDKIFAK